MLDSVDLNNIDNEDLSCPDFENMLLNPEKMNDYLRKIKNSCNNFEAKFDRYVDDVISNRLELCKQIEDNEQALSTLVGKKKELKTAIDEIKIEQKVVEKKTNNINKEIEKTNSSLESLKEKKEQLSLEIVDLEEGFEKCKDHMKKSWNAIKRVCILYKSRLDIHIAIKKINHIENVIVTFFYCENPTDKKFILTLTYQDDHWYVKNIEPELNMENRHLLNLAVQFTKQSKVTNVTLLLCTLRNIFIKNYFTLS